MERKKRPIIAVSTYSGDIKQFASESEAARLMGISIQAVQNARMWGGTAGIWRVYDTPENIRKRIAKLEGDIKFLEAQGL